MSDPRRESVVSEPIGTEPIETGPIGTEPDEWVDAGAQPPNELESLLLSAALVVGLVLFALGCTVLDWFG